MTRWGGNLGDHRSDGRLRIEEDADGTLAVDLIVEQDPVPARRHGPDASPPTTWRSGFVREAWSRNPSAGKVNGSGSSKSVLGPVGGVRRESGAAMPSSVRSTSGGPVSPVPRPATARRRGPARPPADHREPRRPRRPPGFPVGGLAHGSDHVGEGVAVGAMPKARPGRPRRPPARALARSPRRSPPRRRDARRARRRVSHRTHRHRPTGSMV